VQWELKKSKRVLASMTAEDSKKEVESGILEDDEDADE